MSEDKKPPTVAEAIQSMTGVAPAMIDLGNGAKAAAFSMAALKDALLGDETLDQLIAERRCSKNVGCGKSLVKEDGSPLYVFDTKEEADTYDMEFRRTGLCPSCLNSALTALDGEEPDEDEDEGREPECNGICLSASDIGVPASGIAYPHPECPTHGDQA